MQESEPVPIAEMARTCGNSSPHTTSFRIVRAPQGHDGKKESVGRRHGIPPPTPPPRSGKRNGKEIFGFASPFPHLNYSTRLFGNAISIML
jgi:hypothetical protein